MASAQTFDATNMHGSEDPAAKWLVQTGDNPAWAESGFDDSHWIVFDPATSLKTIIPNSQPEVMWYRLHVKVAPSETGLAVEVFNLASAFELYVNGQRLMGSGQVAPFHPYTSGARLLERISDQQIATGNLVIALRVHISKTEWGSSGPGFYIENMSLGQESALREHIWLKVIGDNALLWMDRFAGFGLGLVAVALFAAQRQHKEYLWIFLQFFFNAATLPLNAYQYFHNVPTAWNLLQLPLGVAGTLFQVLMFFAILRMRFTWWLRALLLVAGIGAVFSTIGQGRGSLSALASLAALFPFIFLLSVVLPILLVIHWRRGNGEAGILLIPVFLTSLFIYFQVTLSVMSQFSALSNSINHFAQAVLNMRAGPILLDIGAVTGMLYVLSLAIIIILRSTRISKQQAQLEGEVAAAWEVQQVILPEQLETVPGLQIESIYHPAQQVGGDFFQIIPHKTDASVMIVTGDVVGKGLKAGMLVALLVGAIRSSAETTEEPLMLLQSLNRRLLGRGDAQATCMAMRIDADGSVALANAGHIVPYLNGEPMNVEGALPLGALEGANFSVTRFKLSERDRLVMMSDGIAEATDANGKLFGFERVHEMLRTARSAAEVVSAAQKFGQEDDISMISVTRTGGLTPALV